jgi:hypothetical protein
MRAACNTPLFFLNFITSAIFVDSENYEPARTKCFPAFSLFLSLRYKYFIATVLLNTLNLWSFKDKFL